jgi:hypothetical protein
LLLGILNFTSFAYFYYIILNSRFSIILFIMKKHLLFSIVTIVLVLFSSKSFSQATNGTLNLGILESFEANTGGGGVANSGGTVTGDVGTHLGIISGFPSPPYTGNTYNANAVTNQARYDLLRMYIHLNALSVDFPSPFNPLTAPAHAVAFGGGETLAPGVYSIGSAGSVGGALTLDGGGNPNAFFVIKMNGALTITAGATISLTNGTKSSNVFFVINGAISVAAGAEVKGTLFSKAGAVGLGAGVILEGRMLSLAGALTMGIGSSATPPPEPSTISIFCESSCSPAPAVDILGVLSGFALFAKAGDVANTAISGINGIIGTNAGAITGYNNGISIGTQEIANALTVQAAADLDAAYNSLMALTPTVVTHTARFLNETLASGVYHIPTAGSLGGIIILDAANDPNAIFVFRFAGAFNIDAASKIILINGARRCNVFWIGGASAAGGALNIGASCEVQGTFLAHGGACNSGSGVFLAGRQFSTLGAVNTDTCVIYNNPECVTSKSLNAPAIEAVTDSPSALSGSNTASVINNDTLNGTPVVIGTAPGEVTLTFTNSAPLTMNPDGTITVASNTAVGSYPITYTICEVSNPTSCSTVTSTVTVTALAIAAANDSYNLDCPTNSTLGNVLTNDKIDNKSITSSEVIITLESGANANISLNTTTGDLSINNSLAYGIYTLGYKICQATNTTNCSSGTITISLVKATEPSKVDCSDTYTFTNCAWVKDNNTPTIR